MTGRAKWVLSRAIRVFSKKLLRQIGAHFGGVWGVRLEGVDARHGGEGGGGGGTVLGGVGAARSEEGGVTA